MNNAVRNPVRPFPARFKWFDLIALAIALISYGCATPIGVNYVEPRIAYHSLTANLLSAERPSSFSSRELINLNLYQRFEEEPEKALAEMHSGLAHKGDEDRVFALAELSFVHAQNSAPATTQGHPETIQEIKRILIEHARAASGANRATTKRKPGGEP